MRLSILPPLKFTPRSILVYGGLAFGLYILYTKFIANKPTILPQLPQPNLVHSKNIILNISPSDIVESNNFMVIDGAFLDANNKAVTVPTGYYYIFRDTGLSTGYQFVYAGTLGNNVSTFHANIPTTFFQDGSYEIVVSDEPLPDNILQSGKFANPPYEGETSFKDNSNVIKNAINGFNPVPPFTVASNPALPTNVPNQPNMNMMDLASLQ